MSFITVRVRCFPTENPEKVRQALLNLFPDALVEEYEGGLLARTGSLDRFKELIRNQRILDSTRHILVRGVRDEEIVLRLNKQVAFVGKVSFVDEEMPLGSIEVFIEAGDPQRLIDEVAPLTTDGKEVVR